MPPLIELIHVCRSFDGGRIVALNDVSLKISRGETVAIVGPSGSGKSTLLNHICGLDYPNLGEIHFDGLVVRGRTAWARIRAQRIGIVFQNFCLISTLTAKENVEVAMLGQIGDSAGRRKRALSLLASMDLAKRVNLRPMELSGGERQRVAIARALANCPDALVADEPTGSLDQTSSRSVMRILSELQQQTGMTLIIVTHDQSVAGICGRQIELIDGRIVSDFIRRSEKVQNESTPIPARGAA
jgi:ABC-type lipoprotein export system ATPase subunit